MPENMQPNPSQQNPSQPAPNPNPKIGVKLYEGKAKILYTTADPQVLLVHYKNDATAFNAQKRGTIAHKGEINCAIATHLFRFLEHQGVPTHFIAQTAPDQMMAIAVQILPIEVVVRNIAAGSLCKRLGLVQGEVLKQTVVEMYYKDDVLGDPLINEDHIALLSLATPSQAAQLKQMALQINDHLQDFFGKCQLLLVDFKLEFGLDFTGKIILGDEISPDTCRLWDQHETDPQAKIMDKDRFRQDLGGVEAAYQAVRDRILQQDFS
jgi:phosphoribosylaminoimidazole-succinocarboxamide synthase